MDWTTDALAIAGTKANLAKKLNVSAQAVAFWASGARVPEPALCSDIERLFGVRRWRIRPTDWHRIWPELVGIPGAPEAPTKEAA